MNPNNNNDDNNTKQELAMDDYLEDRTTEEIPEGYIKPNIETKLSKEKRQTCREIVKEINKFGVTERQKLYLIQLLALELSDINLIKKITLAIGEHRENISLSLEDLNKTVSIIIDSDSGSGCG